MAICLDLLLLFLGLAIFLLAAGLVLLFKGLLDLSIVHWKLIYSILCQVERKVRIGQLARVLSCLSNIVIVHFLLVRERNDLLLNCLANQGFNLRVIESTLRLVNELAIANQDDLSEVALDLDHILEQFSHFRKMSAVVLFHLEDALASVRVQGKDHESIWLSEAWALSHYPFCCWHNLSFPFTEDNMRFVCIIVLISSQLEQNLAGRSSGVTMQLFLVGLLLYLLISVFKTLLMQANETKIDEVLIFIIVRAGRKRIQFRNHQFLLLAINHLVL